MRYMGVTETSILADCEKCSHKSNKILMKVKEKNSFEAKEKKSFWSGVKNAFVESAEFERQKQEEKERQAQ